MSVGPTNIAGSLAGSPLAQSQGADVDRARQESSDQSRRVQSDPRAEQASGIGQTEDDSEAQDRDADGRRPWEIGGTPESEDNESNASGPDAKQPRSRDATGQKGNQLDMMG